MINLLKSEQRTSITDLPISINTHHLTQEELELYKRNYIYTFEIDDEDEFIILIQLK